ncbi:DegQ family serine endoprotease [Pararhizobium mangrovi]|uniref:Probable periplasmic serine endoprotease DegP-like n=1 Tax=Pararhizobium mangrovi TaxID=2590452 RepID=A0A506UHY3_9HYPH|nr:DegQ family serine endoprotease [Pararhizobium mangrovi]TPW32908.1 DegQ family serine endoprotease [Pararhizobium mangrovi]
MASNPLSRTFARRLTLALAIGGLAFAPAGATSAQDANNSQGGQSNQGQTGSGSAQTAPDTAKKVPQPGTNKPSALQQNGPASVADLSAKLLDAVVNISSSQNVETGDGGKVAPPKLPEGSPFQDFFNKFFDGEGGQMPPSGKVDSLGSGFVIDPSGLIVTNNHVIENADDVEVTFTDGTTRRAKVLGIDDKTDLALLKVDAKTKLPYVSFGDSDSARIGDWVMAIGNPFGLGGSVTLGIISARGRNINAGPYDNFIQTDAAINRGNSGGPLFNMKGDVIGINTAIISPSGGSIGIGFSIPSEIASSVIGQLRQYGETRRGWLGVRIQPVTDEISESLDMDHAEGALVAGVVKGGPVDNGSLEAGDVIVSFDGKPVKEMRDLPRMVAETAVGQTVDMVVLHDGKRKTVSVKLGRLESDDASAKDKKSDDTKKQSDNRILGMSLAKLDPQARKRFGIAEDVEGVVVTDVDPNSAAADKRIAPGNVIVEVAQEQVKSPDDVRKRVASLKKDGRRNALVMMADKSGELRFLTVQMD